MIRYALLLPVCLVLAAWSCLNAIANVTQTSNPETSLAVHPGNGIALETKAADQFKQSLIASGGIFPERIHDDYARMAAAAFAAEPLAASAVALLALKQSDDRRTKLMELAASLSKREPISMAWSISYYGQQQDIAKLIYFYDTSMRTSRTSNATLIPAMVSVIGYDGFAEPMMKQLEQDPPWAGLFWKRAANTKEALASAAKLRLMLSAQREDQFNFFEDELILNLTRNGHFSLAEDVYNHILETGSQLDTDDLIARRDIDRSFPPFDWQLFSTGKYFAFIDSDSRLNLNMVGGANGLLARKLVNPGVGRLRLQLDVGSITTAERGTMVKVHCADPEAGSRTSTLHALQEGKNLVNIDIVEDGCQYYWVDLEARMDPGSIDTEVVINRISL